jgi:hypothetical protein
MDLIAIPRQKKLLSLSGICESREKKEKTGRRWQGAIGCSVDGFLNLFGSLAGV